jgi:hypothetical protein
MYAGDYNNMLPDGAGQPGCGGIFNFMIRSDHWVGQGKLVQYSIGGNVMADYASRNYKKPQSHFCPSMEKTALWKDQSYVWGHGDHVYSTYTYISPYSQKTYYGYFTNRTELTNKIKNTGKLDDSAKVNAVLLIDYFYNAPTTIPHGDSTNILYATGAVKTAKYNIGMLNGAYASHGPHILCLVYGKWFGNDPQW